MDKGAWWATIHRIMKSWTQLNLQVDALGINILRREEKKGSQDVWKS